MSDSARLREDAERRCGDNADTIRQLAAEVRALRAQLDAYLNDPSQVIADLREECDLVAGQRDDLAEEAERLRAALERIADADEVGIPALDYDFGSSIVAFARKALKDAA